MKTLVMVALLACVGACGDDDAERDPDGYDSWSLFSGAELEGVTIGPSAACASDDGGSMRVLVCTIADGSEITALHLISEGRATARLLRLSGSEVGEISGEGGAMGHRIAVLDMPSISDGSCYQWSVSMSAGSCVAGIGLRSVTK